MSKLGTPLMKMTLRGRATGGDNNKTSRSSPGFTSPKTYDAFTTDSYDDGKKIIRSGVEGSETRGSPQPSAEVSSGLQGLSESDRARMSNIENASVVQGALIEELGKRQVESNAMLSKLMAMLTLLGVKETIESRSDLAEPGEAPQLLLNSQFRDQRTPPKPPPHPLLPPQPRRQQQQQQQQQQPPPPVTKTLPLGGKQPGKVGRPRKTSVDVPPPVVGAVKGARRLVPSFFKEGASSSHLVAEEEEDDVYVDTAIEAEVRRRVEERVAAETASILVGGAKTRGAPVLLATAVAAPHEKSSARGAKKGGSSSNRGLEKTATPLRRVADSSVESDDSDQSIARDKALNELAGKAVRSKADREKSNLQSREGESEQCERDCYGSSVSGGSGVTDSEGTMSDISSGNKQQGAEVKEGMMKDAAFSWGLTSGNNRDGREDHPLPPAWIVPESGVMSGKIWAHALLRPKYTAVWADQMVAVMQPGSILTIREALDAAESERGLILTGYGMIPYVFRLPQSSGLNDFSHKRVTAKTAGSVAYRGTELYTPMSVLNADDDPELAKIARGFPELEFGGDLSRFLTLIDAATSGFDGSNIFDDPSGIRDPRLGLKPEPMKRGQETRMFKALVKQHCVDRYLDPSHAGEDARKYCVTRFAQVLVFVLQRIMLVFATLDVRSLNTNFYRDWLIVTQGDEVARGQAEMTRMFQDALRLCCISCKWCHTVGSCNLFCKDPKCVSHQSRSGTKKPAGNPGVAGTKDHFDDAKYTAARLELKLSAGAPVPWKSLAADWSKKFVADYAAQHGLGSAWSVPTAKSTGAARDDIISEPESYWNNQSAVKGLMAMARQFEGTSAVTLGGLHRA